MFRRLLGRISRARSLAAFKNEGSAIAHSNGRPAPFDLPRLIDDCISASGKPEVQLSSAIQPDVPRTLIGEPESIRQILLRLIRNAVRFTQRGKISIEVRIRRCPDGSERLCFSVSDTGSGISAPKKEAVFCESSRLRVFRDYIRSIGGELGFQSIEGLGSHFYFELPFSPSGGNLSTRDHR